MAGGGCLVGVCPWRSRGEAGAGGEAGRSGAPARRAHPPAATPPRAPPPPALRAPAGWSGRLLLLLLLLLPGARGSQGGRRGCAAGGHRRGRPGSAWRRGRCALDRGQRPGAQGAAGAGAAHTSAAPPAPPARPPLPAAPAGSTPTCFPAWLSLRGAGGSAAPWAPRTHRRESSGRPAGMHSAASRNSRALCARQRALPARPGTTPARGRCSRGAGRGDTAPERPGPGGFPRVPVQGALVAQRGPDFPPSTSGSARGAAVPVTPLSQGHGESRVGGSLNSCLPRGRCSHSGSFALPARSPCHLENCARFLPGEAAGWTLRSFPTFGRGKDGMNWSHYITELSRFLTVCSLTGTR